MLSVNGITLSLYSAGPVQGPVVWLLHGFPESWYSWRHQMQALADVGYRVTVPEMRGYGQSSAPDDVASYDLLTVCGDIQAAMDLLEQRSVAVVGHDSHWLKSEKPDEVNRLLLDFFARRYSPVDFEVARR